MMKLILAVHIAGGATALLSMVPPLVARKGGRVHVRAGWVFVSGMTVVSITAFILSAARFLFDPQGGPAGLFLFYIAILTAAGVSAGIRALRGKRRTGPQAHPWDIGMAALLTATGLGMAAYGAVERMPLFIAFSAIGILNGVGQLRYWLRPPTSHMHWWYEHMSGMLGSCIAAVTAFLVNNASHLGLPRTSLIVWLGPAAIGGTATAVWTAYYRRRFERRRAASAAPVAA
jgi:uncharacterized membrane protein